MLFNIFGVDAAKVAHAAATIIGAIRVENLSPVSAGGNTDAVLVSRDRSEVETDENVFVSFFSLAQICQDAIGVVAAVDPAEALFGAVEAIERRMVFIKSVEVTEKGLHAAVAVIFRQVPVQALVEFPLYPLTDFVAHEIELLAGGGELVGVEQSGVGELLPVVPGHLAQNGLLAVHDFVVG